MDASLIRDARRAAMRIEKACAHVAHHACQDSYGVIVEALVGEEWIDANDVATVRHVEAVRFMDCDGSRGRECRTAGEIEGECTDWIARCKQD